MSQDAASTGTPPPALGEVLDFMRVIWEVSHALERTSRRMESTLGVTGPQRLVIRLVGRFPGIPAGHLARLLHVHPSTLTGIVKRLESQGLVRRRPDPRDRRRSLLGLTDKGRTLDVETEVAIARQEARPLEADGVRVVVPQYMADVVAQLSQLARESPHINQRSGVSVRLTVSNLETLVANGLRRSLVHGESDVVPRVSDLDALASSTAGKVEIESIDEGRDEQVVEHILKSAILTTFRDSLSVEDLRAVVDAFEGSRVVHAGEDVSSAEYVALLEDMKALREPVLRLTGGDESAASIASAVATSFPEAPPPRRASSQLPAASSLATNKSWPPTDVSTALSNKAVPPNSPAA